MHVGLSIANFNRQLGDIQKPQMITITYVNNSCQLGHII